MKAVMLLGIGVLAFSALVFHSGHAYCQTGPVQPEERMVDVQGHKMHVQVAGMEKRKPGQPVVVFENGLAETLFVWKTIFPQIARFTSAFAYERAGIGQSDSDGQTPTPRHIAENLHALLKQIDVRPPYILVGFSLGGALIRMFTGIYPEEVAGLVYVDPMVFTTTDAEDLAIFKSIGSGPEGRKAFWQLQMRLLQTPGSKAEGKMCLELVEQSFKDFQDIKSVPDIPVVTLMATRYEWGRFESELPFDLRRYFDAWTEQRLEKLPRMTREVSEGSFVMTPNSGHYIPLDEPALLVWAIERAVFSDIGRHIRRAIVKRGVTAIAEAYRGLKESYPAERFNLLLLDTLGYEFLRGGKAVEAVAIFELNVKEYPTAWEPYDSLAEGYMTQGAKVKAIANYRKSLELNPKNQNAVDQLKQLEKK